MNINQQMNLLIHLPLTLTCHTLSNLFDIEVIQETLLTIFSVMSSQKTNICGNITAAISDHLPQFLISPNSFANPPSNKYVFERDCSKYDQENVIFDFFDIDWSNLLNLHMKKMLT